MARKHNFNAGPAALPEEVLLTAQRDMLSYEGLGLGIMEMSHRSPEFIRLYHRAVADLRTLLAIPANYKVLFLQGGGTGMFAMVPLNLASRGSAVDYVVTGEWSKKAYEEAARLLPTHQVNIAASSEAQKFTSVPPCSEWTVSPDSAYLFYCGNETIHGVELHHADPAMAFPPKLPAGSKTVLVADLSSNFLTGALDVAAHGVIFAGAQKNSGCAGVTIVIVREDLLGQALPSTPAILNWQLEAANESMYHTPPTWAIYISSLVFVWMAGRGGLVHQKHESDAKAAKLYAVLDTHANFFRAVVSDPASRSRTNVVFRIVDAEGKIDPARETSFAEACERANLLGLKGHRIVGGLRASLYNAVSPAAVDALCSFMVAYAAEHGPK